MKQSLDRHWIEIVQDHIDEFPEEERGLLDRVLTNLREGKHASAGFDKGEKNKFFEARGKLWQKILGMNFTQWNSMRQSIKDKKKHDQNKENIKTKPDFKVERPKTPEKNETHFNPENVSGKTVFRIMNEARGEFTEEVLRLLDKKLKGTLDPRELRELNKARSEWFQNRFGVAFENRADLIKIRKKGVAMTALENKRMVGQSKKTELAQLLKKEKIRELHDALRNLDEGKIVEQFRDETRKVIYYEEGKGKYFIEKNDDRQYLGMGDILADYAWGIKYVPDGEMIEPAYRTIVKRILVNETRRDLEHIYDEELSGYGVTSPTSLEILEKSWLEGSHIGTMGMIAERMAREYLTRLSLNTGLNFTVMRANVVEDSIYKYDFKLRAFEKDRGVGIESQPLKPGVKRVGIQFTIGKTNNRKLRQIREAKMVLPEHKLVDDIILVKITTNEFGDAFTKWLEANKPSGGPEQFLSRDLKIRLLKKVTKGLVDISDEDIERIFPV